MRRISKWSLLGIVAVGFMATRAEALVITTAKDAGADSYVRSGPTYGGTNHGTSDVLLLKNRGGNTQNFSRKGYLRFDLSGVHVGSITGAMLKVTVSSETITAASLVNVFGLNDLDAGESWGEGTITWNNAPANVTTDGYSVDPTRTSDLGDMTVPNPAPGGTLVTFSSSALTTAVGNDTNDLFTLILTRVSGANTSINLASKDNTTYAAPTLELAGAGMTWDGGGGANQDWSQGLNWTGDASPGPGDHATFDDTAAAGSAGTVTNVVDTDFTIGSLTYKQFVQNSKYHTTQIDPGVTLKVTDALEVNNNLTIPPSTYTTTVNTTVTGAGTLQVGNAGSNTATILMGYNPAGGDVDTGILDLSGLATFTAHLDTMRLGYGGAPAVGNLTLAASSTVNANAVVIGENGGTGIVTAPTGSSVVLDVGTLTIGHRNIGGSGTTSGTLDLGASNTIYANRFLIGHTDGGASGATSTGTVTLPAGGTLTLGSASERGDLFVGYKTANVAAAADGTLDLTGGTFNAWLDELYVGYNAHGNTTLNTSGTLTLGATSNLIVNKFAIGDTKGVGTVSITPGGTLTLGSASERADLLVGHNSLGSSYASTGTLDLSNGTFNAWLDELAIGRSLSGTGPPTGTVTLGTSNTVDVNTIVLGKMSVDAGTLTMGGGTVTVNGNVAGGAGASTLNVNGGTVNITGNLTVDNLLVGKNAKTGLVTVGGSAQIGGSGSLTLGIRDIAGGGTTSGTLNLASTTSVKIDVDTITLADVPGGGSTATVRGILHLGASNTIAADTFYVGRRKGTGTVDIVADGRLDLGSDPDPDRVDLKIGFNDENTSRTATGTMNLSAGTFVAFLDELVIGHKGAGTANGSGIGTLTLSDKPGNDVKVNSVMLGDFQSTGTGTASGTINMAGGTFTAGSIAKGAGTANFNWTGGTLHVGTFGTDPERFDLLNDDPANPGTGTGTGTLAPGASSPGFTEVWGNYTQGPKATYEVELEGYAQSAEYDFTRVHGTAILNGTLAVIMSEDFQPPFCTELIILEAEKLDGEFDVFDTSEAQFANQAMRWELVYRDGLVILHAVPEPASLTLLALGGLGLLLRRRRNR